MKIIFWYSMTLAVLFSVTNDLSLLGFAGAFAASYIATFVVAMAAIDSGVGPLVLLVIPGGYAIIALLHSLNLGGTY